MKRLILRISALVTVVVLGLIAIAQAQRGAPTPSDPSEGPSRTEFASGEEGEPKPIVPEGGARFMPAPPTRMSTENPLRGGGFPSSPNPVRSVANERELPVSPGTSAAVDPPPAVTVAQGSASPVADRYSASAARTATDIPSTTDPPPSMADPPRSGRSAFPQIVGPASAAELPPAGYASTGTPGGTGTAVTSDPVGTAPPASTMRPAPREPAPFQLDPRAPSSSIPSPDSTLPPPSRFGESRLTPPRDPMSVGQGIDDAAEGDGIGQPGSKLLEGPQTPQLTIQKFAPAEIQVGRAAKLRIKVTNTGQTAASGVEVRDQVPRGTQLVGTTPQAQRGVRGELIWDLGAMQPGQEEIVEVELMPTAEGEIGSVATVRFNAEASARSIATKPELVVEVACPSRVTIGEDVILAITVSNPGTGVATGVVLEEHVPAGLQHTAGTELEYEVGTLKPNEARKLELTLEAARPGPYTNLLVVRGDANLRTENKREVTIVAPQLDVAMDGPNRRYLERKATYTVSISNPGTAPARAVELVAQLPHGLDFVSADNQGHYDQSTRTVLWRLAELPINTTGSVKLTTMPMEAGQKTIRIAGTAEKVSPVEKQQPVQIEGIAAILFQVVDVDDPIEKGGETAYEIRVVNQGSKAATNVQIVAQVPPEMKIIAAEGPVRHLVNGNQVRFESLSRLAPKADTTYRVRVQGLQPGDLRIRVQLQADEMDTPVVKEESTRVYSDE